MSFEFRYLGTDDTKCTLTRRVFISPESVLISARNSKPNEMLANRQQMKKCMQFLQRWMKTSCGLCRPHFSFIENCAKVSLKFHQF